MAVRAQQQVLQVNELFWCMLLVDVFLIFQRSFVRVQQVTMDVAVNFEIIVNLIHGNS